MILPSKSLWVIDFVELKGDSISYLITVHFTVVFLRLSARSSSLPFGHRTTVYMLLKTGWIYVILTWVMVRPQDFGHLKRLRTPAKVVAGLQIQRSLIHKL